MSATAQFVQITLDSETIGGAWKLYHYEPGTTNLKDVWVDRAKGTPAAQPLVADANGTVSFYGDGLYDLVVYNSADVLKYTWEDVYLVEVPSLGTEGSTLASAGTMTLGAASEIYNHISGAVTITALSGTQAFVILTFDSTPTLTDGTSFQLRNRTSRQARADETVMFVNDGAGVWREVTPVLRLANAQWLTSRNAAGSAEVNIIRVNSSNVVEYATGTVTGALTVSSGGITVTAGGVTVGGNSSITGTLQVSSTLTPAALVDISGASAGQIKFPGTQNASADVNTLDDYEEGTWVPSLGGNTTYTIQAGTYVKIGSMVIVNGQITVNTLGTGSNITISGFPFACDNSGKSPIGTVAWFSAASTFVYACLVMAVGGTTATINSATAAAASLTTGAFLANGTTINFTIVYKV